MKRLFLSLLLAFAAFAFAGCVHLPSPFANVPSSPSSGASSVSLSNAGVVLPGDKVTATDVKSAKAASPTRQAIQHAVNWVTVICILGSLAAIGFGAFLIYSGQLLAGIKCVVGGVLLMIASIWFAYHWLLVVGLSLIGAGVYLAITYWSQIAPIVSKLETEISPAIADVTTKVASILHLSSPTPAPAISAPAPAILAAPAASASPATVAAK